MPAITPFDNTLRDIRRSHLPAGRRQRLRAADHLRERLSKLTKADRKGVAPIHSMSEEELSALLSDADILVEDLDPGDWTLRSDLAEPYLLAHQVVKEERARRSDIHFREFIELRDMRIDFTGAIWDAQSRCEGVKEALDALSKGKHSLSELLKDGDLTMPVAYTAELAKRLTDAELKEALEEAREDAKTPYGYAKDPESVESMGRMLTSISKMLKEHRGEIDALRNLGHTNFDVLLAERNSREREAARIAQANSRPVNERIAELEQVIARMREGI